MRLTHRLDRIHAARLAARVAIAPPSEFPDRWVREGQAVADGAGRAVITLVGPPRRERWYLESAATFAPAGTVRVFRNAEADANLVAIAPTDPNVLDRNQPQVFYPGSRFVVVFAGAGAAATCSVRLEGPRVMG